MLKRIKDFIFGASPPEESVKVSLEYDKSGQPIEENLLIASAVLLIYASATDQDIAREEAEAICSVLGRNFNLDDEIIPELVKRAVLSKQQSEKIDPVIELINNSYSSEQRVVLLAMLWKIVLADHRIEKLEERLIVKICNKLKLEIFDNERARAMADNDEV